MADDLSDLIPGGRATWGAAPPGTRRPRWRPAAVPVIAGLLAIVVTSAMVITRTSDPDRGTLQRIDLPSAPAEEDGEPGDRVLDAPVPRDPVNVLLVGSDQRTGVEAEEISGQRSDTIAILRADPQAQTLRLLSIPRDLWVPIAGTGREGKINGAYAGGPERLIATIRTALAIPIHRYLEVDFEGFKAVIDEVGGVEMTFAAPTRDTTSGFTSPPGTHRLNGGDALLYARSRHLEEERAGRWQAADLTGDLGRIQRQQGLLKALATQVQRASSRSPGAVDELIDVIGPYLAVDKGFPALELLGLVRAYLEIDVAAVEMATLPTLADTVGTQQILRLDASAARPLLEPYLDGSP